jgi:hypothetical protein
LLFSPGVGKKQAHLIFSAMAFVLAKAKCAVCPVGFFLMLLNKTIHWQLLNEKTTEAYQLCLFTSVIDFY